MKTMISYLIPFLFWCPVYAQSALTNLEAKESLKPLENLTGEWQGEGYVITQEGEKHRFMQYENIKYMLDSTVLMIEGKGMEMDSKNLVHHALGVVFFDPEEKKLFFNGHLVQGKHTTAEAKLTSDGKFVWWFEAPNGATIKYVIEFNENKWVEDGFYVLSEDKQYPFIHMELNKTSN